MIAFHFFEHLPLRRIFALLYRLNRRLENFHLLSEENTLYARAYAVSMLQIESVLTGSDSGGPNLFTSITDVHVAESFANIHEEASDNYLFSSAHYLLNAVSLCEYCTKSCPGIVPYHYYGLVIELLQFQVKCLNQCLAELKHVEAAELCQTIQCDLKQASGLNHGVFIELGSFFEQLDLNNGLWCSLPSFQGKYPFSGNVQKLLECSDNENSPEFLYKYVSKSTLVKILSGSSIKFTALSEFNDPFDGQITRSFRYRRAELASAVKDLLLKHVSEGLELPCVLKYETLFEGNEKQLSNAEKTNATALIIKEITEKYDGFRLESRDIIDPKKEATIMILIVPMLYLLKIDKSFNYVHKESVISFIKKVFSEFENGNEVITGSPVFNKEQMQLLSNAIHVLCLSTNQNSKLMWAHYSDEHKGAMIKIRTDLFKDSVTGLLRQVKYKDKVPHSHSVDALARSYLGFNESVEDDFLIETLTIKSCDWEYEKEWRAFGKKGGLGPIGLTSISLDIIDSIYFGCRFDKSDIREFLNTHKLADTNINLFFSEKDDEFFEVNYFPFSKGRVRNAAKHDSEFVIQEITRILNWTFKSLKQELDANLMKLISHGMLVDLCRHEAAEKLDGLYDVINKCIESAKQAQFNNEDALKIEQVKQSELGKFVRAYDEFKHYLQGELGGIEIPSEI
ncbi:DUF2971 domain-containing protein [Alkalimonas delamerensis]|uniref:DUF2971 domain-containing protein n=1 Tax=Alkalimonas delamerensis TaxID=265981 RepID=A0ABT9GMT0_9GAMM|nr:DUF2971 domain-containing protein [Alkalimonas delamerensis]MDP4528274.1 DUF2971 domain-containing protein [Alkalimonas delamerensis]